MHAYAHMHSYMLSYAHMHSYMHSYAHMHSYMHSYAHLILIAVENILKIWGGFIKIKFKTGQNYSLSQHVVATIRIGPILMTDSMPTIGSILMIGPMLMTKSIPTIGTRLMIGSILLIGPILMIP